MLEDLAGPILELIAQYGLAALFVFLVLDAAMLLPLVPGEILLIIAVTRYAPNQFALAFIVGFATLAATVGSLLLYSIARGGGRHFVMAHPRLFLMSPRRRDKLERLFQRPAGQSLVLFLRLVPVFRLLVNLPAGLARMPALRFFILTFLGNLLFHAGFMYIAFESRRPESAVATHAATLREGYASPAWAYVQANWVASAAVVLGFGLFLSLRASMRAARRPHEPFEGSLVGTLATAALFWGGVALLAGLWIDPPLVYETIALTGYDLRDMIFDVPYEPLSVAAGMGGAAILLALMVTSIRRSARRRGKRSKEIASLSGELERRKADEA